MRFPRALLLSFAAVITTISIAAQPSEYILSVHHEEAVENTPVEVSVELIRTGGIYEILLLYRPFGSADYHLQEMNIAGNMATTTIRESHIIPPFIEYYIKLTTLDGADHTYPTVDPEFNPEMIRIQSRSRIDNSVAILSPQENESLRLEDLVISVSLFDVPLHYDRQQTRLFINDSDITPYTLFTEDILIVVPANVDGLRLSPGQHRIRVEFTESTSGRVHSLSWNFNITGPAAVVRPVTHDFRYNAMMRGESRNESLGGSSTWFNRSTITFEGELPWVRIRSNLHITNEERYFRQPQNRYSLSAETPWLRLHVGDTYPRFPSLIMNGRRLRGFFGQLELGYFNLEYATGQTIRGVEGFELSRIDAFNEFGVPVQPPMNSILVDDSTYAVYSFGTHTRNLTAVRPSFGRRDFVQWGFTYLRAQDDMGSVSFGGRPAESFVIGSDLRIVLDRRRIEFVGQVAGSMQNIDISRGNLDRDELDDIMGSGTVDRLESFVSLKTLQRVITINQYLVPFDPRELSSVALDAHLRVHYFGNHLQVGYIRHGNDYTSFGLSALRRDVAGFRLRDRLRLMQNQLYFDISLENLRDNLNDTKLHTTYFNRFDTSVSYFPRHDFPSVTVGYGYFKNDNRTDPVDPIAIRDITNRFFTQLSHNFFWMVRHTGSLSVNVSLRNDQTARNADVDVYSIISMVNSRFDDIPLRTNLGLGIYQNRIPFFDEETGRFTQTGFNYYSVMTGGEYRLMNDDLIVNASFIPTFGDYNRTVLQAGAQYYFMRNLSVIFRADYLINPDHRNDMISNLMIRYDI
jgi:hypothetical protein